MLLIGNHDIPVMEQRASSVDIFHALAVPYVTVLRTAELVRVDTRSGPLQVAGIPFPVRQRLLTREQYRRMDQEELDDAVTEAVVALIRSLAERLDPEVPSLLAAHLSVQNAHWGSERNIMVGRDVAVPLSALADGRWDYVALGHIHEHQCLNPEEHPPVVYSGSLERVDFGEEGQPKGFCWAELWRGRTEWRYVRVPARPFHTLRVDVREDAEPLEAVRRAVAKRDLSGAVARLVVQMTPEQEPYLRDGDLSPLLADAFFAQVNREVDRAVRDRLEGLDPDSMTPSHLLERYLKAKGKTAEEVEAYLEEAQKIFEEE
jgi:exonuclease SbcD